LWSNLNVTLNNTLLLCNDDSNATISALPENGLAPYTYNWTDENASTISNMAMVDNLPAGLYVLQLTDSYGCTIDAQLTIDQPEALTLSTNISHIACDGEPLGIIEAAASGGTPPYLYALDNTPYTTQNSFSGLSAGFYNLQVEDANGCQQLAADLEMVETPSINLSLGQEQTICLGEFITLKPEVFPPTADLNFFWSSSTTIACDTCQQLYFQPTETATYQLTINNLNDCSATASLVVNVTADRSLYIPNVFSPNDDGLNDFFQIYPGKSIATLSLLQIYDRWGGLVFEGDPQQGWNGKTGQQRAANGVYLYVLQLSYLDGVEEVISGDVILVR
jgi:gliding motility-associated-like protein